MEKKTNIYIAPSLEILKTVTEDVISTSGFDGVEQKIDRSDYNNNSFNF